MIRLLPNTAEQTIYVSPFQARKYLATFTHYLVEFKMQMSNEKYYLILKPTEDNNRYTESKVGTHTDSPTLGRVLITDTGFYTYTIWGQNSSSNLDPENASVIGKCEVGVMQIVGANAWSVPNITIPNNVVYYE
jgi:hypothetical protein